MHLVSFRHGDTESWGARAQTGIVDLRARLDGAFPTLRAALAAGALAEAALAMADAPADFAEDEIDFLPPIPDPDKIFAVQLNYRAHIEELKAARIDIAIPDAWPSVFMRTRGSLVGHLQPIVKPPETDQFDYEGELAVIIGRACRRVPREAALDCIAGYACFNDGSVRDWQQRAPQLTTGKTWERSGAVGPWLATAATVGDPATLRLTTRVNGALTQDTSVGDLLFDVPYLISYLSTICALAPGDVIATGTPGRMGDIMRRFLGPGDEVAVEIKGVGALRNPVVAENTAARAEAGRSPAPQRCIPAQARPEALPPAAPRPPGSAHPPFLNRS